MTFYLFTLLSFNLTEAEADDEEKKRASNDSGQHVALRRGGTEDGKLSSRRCLGGLVRPVIYDSNDDNTRRQLRPVVLRTTHQRSQGPPLPSQTDRSAESAVNNQWLQSLAVPVDAADAAAETAVTTTRQAVAAAARSCAAAEARPHD